jgi:prevent-host-death family protein
VTAKTVPAKELRQHLAEYLDEVRSGESFTVTRSGRVTAQLVPPETRSRLVPPDVEGRSVTVREEDE